MTFSTRAMRPEDWATLRHFTPAEFRAPDRMGYEFMVWLDEVRTRAGVPMKVTSSQRTTERNDTVGGASDSAHLDPLCEAVDVAPANNAHRFEILKAALDLGCTRIGTYANGSLHFDRTEGRRPSRRLWVKARR